jgi:hypothetical protein
LRRLAGFVQAQFGRCCCRETIRRVVSVRPGTPAG